MEYYDLQSILKELGWSQRYFAERLDIHYNTVSKWIAKGTTPRYAKEYLRLALDRKRYGEGL